MVGIDRSRFQFLIADAVRAAGGCLVCADIPMRPTSIMDIPVNKHQLEANPPKTSQIGQRALDLWKRREQLWNASLSNEQASGSRYSLGMWVRDGCFWLDNIMRPSELLAAKSAENTVWTRMFWRANQPSDKSVVFGRAAAPAVLGLFSTFMRGGFSVSTFSTEQFLFQAANHSGIKLKFVPFSSTPEGDAMYFVGDRLCLLRRYYQGPDAHQIPFCEDIVDKKVWGQSAAVFLPSRDAHFGYASLSRGRRLCARAHGDIGR
mmetsp:Transcript_71870/g.208273  ORF Transcript_71870/g.208273 Transcript_71870/m.208273 type:complete len:262 (-) Transcript_71870:21-806(-)